ncbi:MAG: cell division protein FtsA [candidate division Zixibacteria bacterium]|jgi:cell division protein FtsA|nr:cell division protein FtsA [candidate division Zixibacteria bacterium]
MSDETIVAALDIGTTKIEAVVVSADRSGGVYVLGAGQAPAEGLRRGVVVDMDKTVKSIRQAVQDAEMVTGTTIDSVTVGIAGEHIRSINSHGVVAVGRADNEILASDVARAIDAARTVAIPVDREIIHVIPQVYSVDDEVGIKDPVGMSGVRLEVEAHIVTASVTSAKNIYRALERCDLTIDHMVLESLALFQILLDERDSDHGTAIIDIGGDITNLSVFHDGAIRHTAVVSLGSRNVTNDIAIGLRTSVEQAEALKISHGSALASKVDPEEMIFVEGMAGRPSREISCNVLASIIEPRMEEILSLVARELKKAVRTDQLTGGLVLTGGGALLPHTLELAEQMFDMPVRLGTIGGLAHVPDDLNSNRYAAALGLALYGATHEPVAESRRSAVGGWLRRLENWISKQF